MGEGAQQLQCKSESAKCSEKQSPCEGKGGLKLEQNAEKETKHYLKNGHNFPCILYFSFTPNPITQAQHGSSLGLSFLFL